MRGSVALQAALGLLWSSSSPTLVGAMAIEPVTVSIPSEHVHVAAPVARDEAAVEAAVEGVDPAGEPARAIMKFEFPVAPASKDAEQENATIYSLTLEVVPTGSPCGPASLSINSHRLAFDAEGAGHGLIADDASPDSKPFEAAWSVHCLHAEGGSAEASQLLHFDLTSFAGRALPGGAVSFVAQFRQTGPAEILSVAGTSLDVHFEGAYLAHAAAGDEKNQSMLADIARLEALRHRLVDIEDAIVSLEQHIADSYGVDVEALRIDGVVDSESSNDKNEESCTDGFKCTVDKVVHSVSGTAKKIYDQLFGDEASAHEKNHDETVVRRPKQHPIVSTATGTEDAAVPHPTATITASADHAVPSPSTGQDESSAVFTKNMMLFVPAAIMILAILAVLHCACHGRPGAPKEEPDTSSSSSPTRDLSELGFFARIAERRRRRKARSRLIKQRMQIVKDAFADFFSALFRNIRISDVEKEAERRRIFHDEEAASDSSTPVPGPSSRRRVHGPNWVAVDIEAAPFAIGDDSSESDPDEIPYARRLAQPRGRFARDAESITLVGSERSDDDAASESGSVSSGASESDASTTMEMDLARFREATFMVGNLVGASAPGHHAHERIRSRGAATAPPRRPPSPSGSLPGYASDDPYPTVCRHRRASSEADEERMASSVIADGFCYTPGGPTLAPREEVTAKN